MRTMGGGGGLVLAAGTRGAETRASTAAATGMGAGAATGTAGTRLVEAGTGAVAHLIEMRLAGTRSEAEAGTEIGVGARAATRLAEMRLADAGTGAGEGMRSAMATGVGK